MRVSIKLSVLFLGLSFSQLSQALPIGFGRNQGELKYRELKSPGFSVYHDQRAPYEAQAILDALEAARPKLEQWLKVKREDPLAVVVSAATANASFANFIVDAIELQTMGRGGRDLAWHEYTHSTMYRHLDNILGPAGSILHLPWMPAWWIEGLAEALSISNGSDQQYGIERHYALSGDWPTYDKLHSLYDGNRFSGIGYAISGAFVSYIIRTYGADKLPQLLESFYRYSMPWWWAWSFVPFNGFMPMDEALREYTGKNGAELYEEYKAAAQTHWRAQKQLTFFDEEDSPQQPSEAEAPEPPAQLGLPGQAFKFQGSMQMQARDDALYFVNRDGDEIFEAEVIWKGDRPKDWQRRETLPEGAMTPRFIGKDFKIYMTGKTNDQREPIRSLWLQKGEDERLLFKRKAYVSEILLSRDKLIWMEEYLEHSRLCWIPRRLLDSSTPIKGKEIRCPLKMRFPQMISLLGNRSGENAETEEVWLSQSEETLMGDRFKILRWNAASNRIDTIPSVEGGKPLSLAFNGQGLWLALADRQHHFLRRIDAEGRCIEEKDLSQILEKMYNHSGDWLTMSFWGRSGSLLVRSSPQAMPSQPCRARDQPTSPLQMAQRHPQMELYELIALNDPWTQRSTEQVSGERQLIAATKPLGSYRGDDGEPLRSKPAGWHPKPVFAFPWIGVDAKGYQMGTLAVPLMDDLQNETLSLSALYGVESRYPNLELNLISTRWDTTWSFGIFRRQTWNGVLRSEAYYYDERGFEVSAARYLRSLGLGLRAAYRNSYLIPYLGDPAVWEVLAQGYLRELSLGLNRSDDVGHATLSTYVNSNLATKQFNANYDYEQLGFGLNLSIPIDILGKTTSQNWGLSYSRVRGTRRKYLREVYRPLRTFVPGSGGGLNEINQPILGPGALTSAAYGDTQARMQFAWTYPLIEDIAQLIHIVYLQRLDFTAFFNYGDAWNHSESKPRFYDGVRAHGYNLDLQADIKGVKVNLGLGTGQVLGYDFEVYFLFGFDALIEQGKN